MDLSIIIVNYQTKDYLRRCLKPLYNHPSLNNNQEIVVIDNNSADGSVDMVREEFPYVKLICLDENVGFGRANNIGIKSSKGKFLILLNSDTEMSQQTLAQMVEYIEQNEDIGILGCRQFDSKGNLQLSFGKFPTLRREIVRKFLHSRLSINGHLIREYLETKYNGEIEVDWVSGSCMALRREALEQAGLFDPAFFMYFEDIDLCERIKKTNWKVCYNSQLALLHHGGITARQNLARSYIEYRKSQFYFCRKYYGIKGLIVLKMIVFIKFLFVAIRTSFYFLANIFIKKRRKEQYIRLLLCKKVFEMVFRGKVDV